MRFPFVVLSSLLAAAACGGSSHQTNAHGQATYAQPAKSGGKPVAPQQKSDDLKVTVTLTGAGTFDKVNSALCSLTSGDFAETATSTGTISSGGTYVSDYASQSTSTSIVNPSCGLLTNLKVSSVTSMTVQASIPANATNCADYCSATASVQCQGSSDVNCVANATATCKADCATRSSISGHGSMDASALAAANSGLGSSGTVDGQVNLVFDAVH